MPDEFWESSFKARQTMWGFTPADSALAAADFFQKEGLQDILIPGFGYGRNAKVFADKGMSVTGIEISETAIGLAQQHFGEKLQIFHGPVSEMPFDQKQYDGIFCYALIHLLDAAGRQKLIADCFRQLRAGGYMVFVALSKNTATYGVGTEISKNRFKSPHGVELFYYDRDAVEQKFGPYGLLEAKEIDEPARQVAGKASQRFWQVICRRGLEQ